MKVEEIVLENKKVNRLVKLIVPQNQPKKELNYLNVNADENRLEVTDTKTLLVIKSNNFNFKDDKLVAIRESKKTLLYVELDKKYVDVNRIIPDREWMKKISDFTHFIRYDDGKKRFDIENKRVYLQVMNIVDNYKDLEFGVYESGVFSIYWTDGDINFTCLIFGWVYEE